MHAALEVNIPNNANAIVTPEEIVGARSPPCESSEPTAANTPDATAEFEIAVPNKGSSRCLLRCMRVVARSVTAHSSTSRLLQNFTVREKADRSSAPSREMWARRSALQAGSVRIPQDVRRISDDQPVESLEITALGDNATDRLSTNPGFVETEMASAWRRGDERLSGGCICCAAHGLSCLITTASWAASTCLARPRRSFWRPSMR